MLLSDYSIKNRVAVFVFVVVLVVLGAASYVTLPREGAPDVTIPYVFITSIYEGVAPSEIENLISIPLEKKLDDLANVKEITSSSAEGVSMISIEFTPEQNIETAVQKVKNKIDLAKPDLPDDLDEPVVKDINLNTEWPILTFAIAGDTTLERLKHIGEDLEDRIEALPGVLQATVYGGREREVRVEVDIQLLMVRGIPLSTVMGVLYQENATLSAGSLEAQKGAKFQVRIPGEFEETVEIGDLVLAVVNDRPVYLRDVADVRDTFKDRESISRLNGKPCVSVTVQKRTGENTVALTDELKGLLADYELPPGISLTMTNDQSGDIRMMLSELENNVASGFVLVVAVLFVFMGLRNSLLVALAIPFSMLISFAVLRVLGITLNMIVLFSLVLALGMLVDNAIVIVENIYRRHSEGDSRMDAARGGASEVAWPVITSTLTTLAAFSPLLFWPGIMGQFMGYLPKTLICTLTASLFVAIVINPAICSLAVRRNRRIRDVEVRKRHPFVFGYERLLRVSLANRGLLMLVTLCCLVLTFVAFGTFGSGVELFPETDPRRCSVEVRYPEGTSIEKTDVTLRAIEEQCARYDDIEFILGTVGASGVQQGGGGRGTHLGNIDVRFVDSAGRKGSTARLVERIRKEMALFPGAKIKVEKEEEGPPAGPPVCIEISGDDFDVLARLSSDVQRRVKGVPGLADIQDDVENTRPEVRFVVDREKAALFGVDTRSIGSFLRTAVQGEEATKFRAGEDEYDITVRLPAHQRNNVGLLDQLAIPTRHGSQVPLSSLGEVVYAGGRGAVNRKNQKRTVTVSGNNESRGVDKILADVEKRLVDMQLPKGYSVAYTGDHEEMQESGRFLSRAFGVALALIVVILVLQFNSALLPVVIMMSVLLSLVGVMWGLLACDMRFGIIMTGLGVISLAGIVVNNAIVLIDCIRQHRENGVSATEAIVTAGRLRLRPVLLTAITTVLGLIPMAIGYSLEIHDFPPRIVTGSETSAWWAPMAVAVIFGLVVATILTLVIVPVMYSLMDSFAARFRWYFRMGEEQ